jgi:DNA-binding NtrC family response regulator
MHRILIIDDDIEFRQTLRKMLEKADFEVIEAIDGSEALEAYCATKADLVITDIAMPEKDGLQAISELRQHDPLMRIVAISGIPKHSQSCLEVAKQLGACAILEKPFSYANLLEVVNSSLE